ncbi:MAG: HNH endonuclease [Sulfurospirillum sp.]|nr:HNH endonuclease [Sulfurospirillum sp.]
MDNKDQIIEKYLKRFSINEEQKIFIKCYSFERKSFKEIEKVLHKYDNSKTYKDVQRLNIECNYYVNEIQKIRNKFTDKRKDDNNNSFESFLEWYSEEEENGCCGYCGVTQNELHTIFIESKVLPLNDKVKRSSGALEIERKDSLNNSYNISNLILACPLCNNAKSNLIDEASWRNLFAPAMRKYYEQLLGKSLNNPLPK